MYGSFDKWHEKIYWDHDQTVKDSGMQVNKNELTSASKSFFSDQYEGGADDDNFKKVPKFPEKEKKFDL